MKLFATSFYYKQFLPAITGVIGEGVVERYPNGEGYVQLKTDVTDQDCLIVGSIAPPDEQLLTVLWLAGALKQNKARSVRAFLPYLAYARQDKPLPGQTGGTALVGALLRAAGVDEIVTIDVHSERAKQLAGLPLISLPAAPLFAKALRQLAWPEAVFLAPDQGAIARTQALAEAVGGHYSLAHLIKTHDDGIRHLELVGELTSRQVIIVDDIIDTGQTLISACKLLVKRDVQDIAIVVTHGLFTGNDWQQLFDMGVRKLFVSASCPEAQRPQHPAIEIVALEPAFQFNK